MSASYIDGENVSASFSQQIMEGIRSLGEICLPPKVYISNGKSTDWLQKSHLGFVTEIVARKQAGKGKSMVGTVM